MTSSCQRWKCLRSCWLRAPNFTVGGENPAPVWDSSYDQRYNSVTDHSLISESRDQLQHPKSYTPKKIKTLSLLPQVQQRAAEKWKDADSATKSLRMSVISNMLKVECCVNGTHSLDEVGLGGFGLYQCLPGLDCTFPRFVLQHWMLYNTVICS